MTGCTSMASNSEDLKAFILSLEEQALKLWNRGNPDGFIELSSDDVVYIDPAFKNNWKVKRLWKSIITAFGEKSRSTGIK